jgi:hypothetical protein
LLVESEYNQHGYCERSYCKFCDVEKSNNHSKSYKSLKKLRDHIQHCPNVKHANGRGFHYSKIEIYRLVNRAYNGDFQAFQRLRELGMVK